MQTRYLRALIAIGTISAIAGASFFVANRLSTNQSVAPNAPDSNPQAYLGNTKGGPRLADEDIRDIQRGINGSTSNPPRTNNPTRTILRDDEYEEAYQRPTVKSTPKPTAFQTPQNTGGGSGANPSAIKTPTPNKPAPTPTFVSGTFGYQATDEQRKNQNSYMSDANNDCDDGQGFISGTGCFNGKRRVLGLPDTQRAYQQALVKAQNEITNKSDEELLQLSGKSCPPTDNKCRETAIADATNQLLKANAVVLVEDKKKISDTRTVNQATQDILFLNKEEFERRYGPGEPKVVFEQLLTKLGTTKEALGITVDINSLVASREVLAKYSDPNISLGTLRTEYCKTTNDPTCLQDFKREDILNNLQLPSEYKTSLITAYKAEATKGEKITEQTLAFLSNKSDQELAKEFCANSGNKTACERSFEREDLLANNPNPQEIIQMKKDQSFAQMYADPRNSTSDLAKIYCDSLSNPGPKCKDEYNSNAILSLIANPQTKQEAINKRISALSLLIPQVVNGEPVTGIDVETKKEIIKINEDTTYAFWVYVRENSARQHKQNVTTEQLAIEFNELVKQNPSALTENLKKYNANPKQYNMSFTTFKFDQEENPLILAQYNQIIKTQPIKGLFENNKIVTWNQASEEYKQEARKLACENDKSIAIYCSTIDGYAANRTTEEQKKTALAQIDAAMANSNKQTAYLQQVYNSRTTDNLLSVNQSNLATVDNPALGDPILQAEIKKAQAAAESQRQADLHTLQLAGRHTPTLTNEKIEDLKVQTDEERAEIANEYLRRQLVVETYTRGTGVSGALATATVATIACSGLGFGAVGCGAVAGLAGVISNIIPILGNATAEEIEAERQKIADFVGNDSAATFIQAMYSNQGAASDESLVGGRSQSALNNQYALLDRIHQTNYQTGATTNTLTDPTYQAQIAIQPYLLQQGEELQLENERQAWVNLAVAPVVGAISGGVGGNIANNANRITQGLITSRGSSQVAAALLTGAKDQAVDTATWFMGTLLNDYQTSLQFDSTVSYLDTQSEINLEICNRTQGSNSAECRQLAQDVRDENQDARNQTRLQAFVTDATIQLGQTSVSAGTTGLNIIRSSANTNTPNPTRPTTQTVDPNDSTFISSNLSQLLNLSDPRILNSSPNDIDTITYSNYLSSQTIGRPDVPARDNTINFINEKPSVANESIMQGVVMYKNLIEPEFKAKLKEIGFNDTDIEIALKIRETEADILYTNAVNERIEQNEAIAGQLRNNPKDQSENLNIKVDQEIMSDYAEFRRQQAEKYVEDAIKAIEAERPSTQPEATVIADTQKEALKAFLAEASNPDRLVPMNPTDITNHLTSLGHSPEDIQSVINKASLPQIKAAIDKVLDFNNRAAQIRKDIANIAPNIQEEINNRIVNQRFDLLNQLTADIPTTPSTDTTSTQSRAFFKPNDDINQEIPGSFNVIGKIPNKEVDGNQVYYKITYLDEKGVETGISNVLPLEDNNPLPLTNDSYTLEFGFLKDGEFTKLTPSGLAGIQTLAMNVSNNYTFGRASAIDQLRNSMNANTQPVLTDAQRNRLVEMYIKEAESLNQRRNISNEDLTLANEELINKYANYGITFDRSTATANTTTTPVPNGYSPLRIALIKLKNLLFDPGTPETLYNQILLAQESRGTADNNSPAVVPDFTDGDQNYLLTLAKDLDVDTVGKSEDQIRRDLKEEMNTRVFGNKNGPNSTDDIQTVGVVFRDSNGNVLSKDFYWRPENFGDPFVFTKKESEAIFKNSKNWKFKPSETFEARYNSFLEKTIIRGEEPDQINGFTIRNSKGQSLDEFGEWKQSFFGFDSGHIFTVDEIKNLNKKIRLLSNEALVIQNVEYIATPNSRNYKDEYSYTDLMKQEALKEAIIKYKSSDNVLTDYLKAAGYTDEEIKYAIDNRKLPESQAIINLLREFDNKADSEYAIAIKNTPRNNSYVAAINALEDRIFSQRQELLSSRFNALQSTNLVPVANNTNPQTQQNGIALNNNQNNNNTLRGALQSLWDRFVPPIDPNTTYGRFISQRQNLNTTYFPETEQIYQILPNLTRDLIQDMLNTPRGQRALTRINDNNQVAHEIGGNRIQYTRRGQSPDTLTFFTNTSANSIDSQIFYYAKSLGVNTNGKSIPEIIALIKEKIILRSTASPEPKQPETANLSDTINRYSNDTRIVNELNQISDNYRVVFNDFVGIPNNADAQFVRFAQEDLGIDVSGKTMQQIASEVKTKQDQARTIPPTATITEVDKDGNLKYTVEGLRGVTLIADKNSPEAVAINKQDPANFINKKAADISIDIISRSPIDKLTDNPNLPSSLKGDIATKFDSEQIADFNAKLADPNYKPKESPLVKIIRKIGLKPQETTPEITLLNKAASLTELDRNDPTKPPKPYNTTDKSLAQIAADIRAVENQFGNNKNLTALTKEQLLKSLEYLPRRLVQGIAEALKISPNAKVVRVDVPRNEHRYIGAKYMHKNQEWSDFLVQTKQKLDNIPDSQMPQSRKDAIVAGIEDLFISHLKSSIVKANPDFKISPKAIDQDTFIDLNPSRKESLELLKRYFNDFDLEIADIINQVNKVLEGGNTLRIIEDGQYVDVQLQKDWGLKLSLSDLRPSKFVFMGLSLDPKVDSYFNIVNNKEAYFIANGANNEILNAVFMFKILDEPNVNLDDTFPVIEQVQRSNDPDTITHHDEVKDFTLYGKPLNKNEIELLPESGLIGRQETNHQTYLASLAEDIIRKLANYNYDSGVAADGLVAQLDIPNRKRAENAIGSAPIEMVFKEGTDLSFNNTTIVSRNTSQVANDIAGFSLTTDTLTNITRDLPPADKEEYFEGFHIIYGTVQNEGTVLMHGLADIKTYEHAGDGFRGTLDGKLNLEAIKKLVDYSSIYQRTLDDAMNGKLGPKAQKTALALFNALGDKVYLKVGIGTGDTLFQYLPGNIEVKSSVNVDEYLNNVKKYINQEKDAKRIPPKEIIGVSKSISDQFSDQDLATVGLRKIVIEKFDGDKTAYFITKLSNDSLNPPIVSALSLEQSARQQSALRYVVQNYNLLDTDLTTILKNLGYNDLEIEYALLARNLPEIQRVIGELKQFDFTANLEMNDALLMILEVGPDYDVESVKTNLANRRKDRFDYEFKKAQSALSGSGVPNSSRPAPESNNNTIKSTVKSRMDQILYPAQQMNSLLFPDIIEIFRPRQTINIPNNNSPITIKNIELIMSPEKNQQFLSSIDTTDQFSSLYNRSTIYYDKNGQIVGFGDISKLHPKTQESILSGQYFKTTMLIPKDGTKKYMIAEVQGSKNIVAHKIITETIGLLNNKETAIALLTQTGKLDNVILRQRVALRRFVSGLIGALVGIKVDENYNEEIKQGFDSFFNTKMSTAALGPVGYNNEQSQTTQQSDTPKTITPTLQNPPTPTPKPNRINENSDSNTRLTSSYNAIIACEQTNKNLTGPRGTQMQLCYCQQVGSDTGVCDTQETKYTSERIRHFYNNNLEYKDENLIFMILPLLDISTLPQFEYTNYLDEDNTSTCKENRICNTRGEEKYAICKLDEIPGMHPTDIVVTNSGKIHLCPKSWGTDLESNAICNQSPYIDPNTNQITYQELKLKPDEIKEVWRSSDYIDTFPGCWAN